MYLYEANKDEIKVYGFWPKKYGRHVNSFKERELRNILLNKKVLKAETNADFYPLNKDNIQAKMFLDELNFKEQGIFKPKFHPVVGCDYNSYDVYKGLESYYNSPAKTYALVEVLNDEIVEYWLVPREYYLQTRDGAELKGIINISEKLRDLYYFEIGQFEKVSNSRLKEFRSLYQFRKTPIQTFDRDNIRELIMCGVIENKITDDILEKDSETIQRLRKIYK